MASVLERYNEQVKLWLNEHDALVQKIRASSEQIVHDMEAGISTFDSITKAFRAFVGMMSQEAQSYSDEINEVRYESDMCRRGVLTILVSKRVKSPHGRTSPGRTGVPESYG